MVKQLDDDVVLATQDFIAFQLDYNNMIYLAWKFQSLGNYS